MKLKELRELIYCDLNIINHSTGNTYVDVWKDSLVFNTLAETKVIGIRTSNNRLEISVVEGE